jgi:hypothetical protein
VAAHLPEEVNMKESIVGLAICIKQSSDVPEEVNTKESIIGLL